MRRPTRANSARTTNNRRPQGPQTTKAQVKLSVQEFAKIMSWPEASDEYKALQHVVRTFAGAGRMLNVVVKNYLWTVGQERFISGCRQWNRAMRELVAYEEQYDEAGRKQGRKAVSNIANTKPESIELPKVQRELILEELQRFYDSKKAKISEHPGDKPEGADEIKTWKRKLKLHHEEQAWAAGFPRTTLFHGTLLSLFLIRLCSTEQDWTKFQTAWSSVEGGVELPEVVLKLRIGPKPEQEEERASA